MYLYNCLIEPLKSSSSHIICNPTRKRKLLLKKDEINFLSCKQKNTGYTMIALSLFWKKSWCKLECGLAKGKNVSDKRSDLKNKEWKREKSTLLKKIR